MVFFCKKSSPQCYYFCGIKLISWLHTTGSAYNSVNSNTPERCIKENDTAIHRESAALIGGCRLKNGRRLFRNGCYKLLRVKLNVHHNGIASIDLIMSDLRKLVWMMVRKITFRSSLHVYRFLHMLCLSIYCHLA